ncbi:MAG: thioredoxin-dependent thiol peroxidase [Polyangiales bacterium]
MATKKAIPSATTEAPKTKAAQKKAAKAAGLDQASTVTLKVGDVAPDFTAATDGGGSVTLSKLRGKTVVVYFYPRDSTPGCTLEACDFRDHSATFGKRGVVVLGVSPDSAKSHDGFKRKHSLPFTLVADPDKAIAHAWGVFKEKIMYGKPMLGIVRSTFVVGPTGKIAKVFERVRVNGHVEAVLATIAESA